VRRQTWTTLEVKEEKERDWNADGRSDACPRRSLPPRYPTKGREPMTGLIGSGRDA
jgi:hypothetical protein